jgi:hypothetical protein
MTRLQTTPKGRKLSEHAQQSLLRHGFAEPFDWVDDIIENYTHLTMQTDGAAVYIQRAGAGRRKYHIAIVSEDIIITAIRNLTPHELNNLAKNYEWTPWL